MKEHELFYTNWGVILVTKNNKSVNLSCRIEKTIYDTAIFYNCNNIYTISEEDGTLKILRYHYIFVVNFLDAKINNFIKFVKFAKKYKSCYVECIYYDNVYKLIYASSYYLKNIDKNACKKYKQFINDKNFNENECMILRCFI